jgi:hypothetical protein
LQRMREVRSRRAVMNVDGERVLSDWGDRYLVRRGGISSLYSFCLCCCCDCRRYRGHEASLWLNRKTKCRRRGIWEEWAVVHFDVSLAAWLTGSSLRMLF